MSSQIDSQCVIAQSCWIILLLQTHSEMLSGNFTCISGSNQIRWWQWHNIDLCTNNDGQLTAADFAGRCFWLGDTLKHQWSLIDETKPQRGATPKSDIRYGHSETVFHSNFFSGITLLYKGGEHCSNQKPREIRYHFVCAHGFGHDESVPLFVQVSWRVDVSPSRTTFTDLLLNTITGKCWSSLGLSLQCHMANTVWLSSLWHSATRCSGTITLWSHLLSGFERDFVVSKSRCSRLCWQQLVRIRQNKVATTIKY